LSSSLNKNTGKKRKSNFKLSLIVSAYNNPSALAAILRNLEAGSKLPNEIHVAEDGSDNKTFKVIKNSFFTIVHHYQEDKGFRKAKILNCAVKACQSDYIIFLDGDCLPHKHFVRDHMLVAEKGYFVQGRRCFVSEKSVPKLLDRKTTLLKLALSGKVSGLLKSIRLPTPYFKRNKKMYGLLGCNLGVWRDDLLKINGFDEEYEGWGREDSDLCARLYNSGILRKMVYGRALVYHLNHPENDRGNLTKNDEMLREALRSGKTSCAKGIFKKLSELNKY